MAEGKKDKRVYHYRSAFMQPTWIQKISDKYSLPNAVKLATFGWTAFFTSNFVISSVERVFGAGTSDFLGAVSRSFSTSRNGGTSIKNFFFYPYPQR